MSKSADELGLHEYATVLVQIKERIRTAQYEALKAVNRELVSLYWDIGRIIVERQQQHSWGKAIVETLAHDLQTEFPGLGGFSASNLWRMKLLFEAYSQHEKLAPLVREIGWSQNITILEKCKDGLEREFYLRMTRRDGWSKATLINQIKVNAYHRFLTNQTNFDKTLPDELRNTAMLAMKDEYTFGFLELGEEYGERQLENAILTRVGPFLREMGGLFTFVGNQFRLEVSGREYLSTCCSTIVD